MLKLCERLIKKEVFPNSFDITTLVELPKKAHNFTWTFANEAMVTQTVRGSHS